MAKQLSAQSFTKPNSCNVAEGILIIISFRSSLFIHLFSPFSFLQVFFLYIKCCSNGAVFRKLNHIHQLSDSLQIVDLSKFPKMTRYGSQIMSQILGWYNGMYESSGVFTFHEKRYVFVNKTISPQKVHLSAGLNHGSEEMKFNKLHLLRKITCCDQRLQISY